jgi:hypothetical protein
MIDVHRTPTVRTIGLNNMFKRETAVLITTVLIVADRDIVAQNAKVQELPLLGEELIAVRGVQKEAHQLKGAIVQTGNVIEVPHL